MPPAAMLWLAAFASGVASTLSCALPPQMCVAERECGAQSSCVAGRCVADGTTQAIASARRLVFAPVDTAYVRRGNGERQTPAAVVALGSDNGEMILLRFDVPLAPDDRVIEAYLILGRAVGVDADPQVISLHSRGIAQPWEGRTVSWARQPRVQDVGAPVTRVQPTSGPTVRLDVHDLVQQWRGSGKNAFEVAVVAEGRSVTGIAFAMAPMRGDDRSPGVLGPELELYVK